MLITPTGSRVRIRSTKSTLNLFNVIGYLTYGRWYSATRDGDWFLLYTGGYVHNSVALSRPDPVEGAPPVHVPQWGLGANGYQNDCGAACLCGLFIARGENVTVDQLHIPHSDPTGLTNAEQLRDQAANHGIALVIERTFASIPLSQVKPYSLLLINYTPIAKYAQDTRFRGWHWLWFVGIDPTDPNYAITLDSDYWGNRIKEGDHKRYPTSALRSAFRPYSGAYTTSLSIPDLLGT